MPFDTWPDSLHLYTYNQSICWPFGTSYLYTYIICIRYQIIAIPVILTRYVYPYSLHIDTLCMSLLPSYWHAMYVLTPFILTRYVCSYSLHIDTLCISILPSYWHAMYVLTPFIFTRYVCPDSLHTDTLYIATPGILTRMYNNSCHIDK